VNPFAEVIQDLGFVPFERAGGELLFNLLAQRYERLSTIITSNLTPSPHGYR
jgi:DNA replication protein DnaC